MTALWETTLRRVQEGNAPVDGFLHAVRVQLAELVTRAKCAGPLKLPGVETRPCRAPGCTGSSEPGKRGRLVVLSISPMLGDGASCLSTVQPVARTASQQAPTVAISGDAVVFGSLFGGSSR